MISRAHDTIYIYNILTLQGVYRKKNSGGSRNFKTGGRGPGAVQIFYCFFYAPSHKPYVFVVRVVNKKNIVNIVCCLKLNYMRVIQSKFTKTNPNFFSNQGGGGGGPGRRAGTRSKFEGDKRPSPPPPPTPPPPPPTLGHATLQRL